MGLADRAKYTDRIALDKIVFIHCFNGNTAY